MALKLITDRTAADSTRAKNFQGKEWDKLTSEQKAEYLLGLRGAYSYVDFNRVENAVKYISDLLKTYGYKNTVNTKTNWTADDIQKVSEIQRYIDNIAELKDKYYSNVEGTMPTTSTWLTIEGANYLEQILVNIDELVKNMEQYYVYSGVANLGQNRLWQQRFRRNKDWNNLIYELGKYDQEWNTVAIPSNEIGSLNPDGRDNVAATLNAWNDKMAQIDSLTGVVN